LAKPFNTINFFNAVCTLLFCFGIQLTIQKKHKKQPYVSTNHGPPLTVFVCFVFWVLYSELDAKAEEQCANSIEQIDRFSRGFCDCCPAFPKPNEEKQAHGGP